MIEMGEGCSHKRLESGTERNSDEGVWGQESPCLVWSLASIRSSLVTDEIGRIPWSQGLPDPWTQHPCVQATL